MGTTPEQDRWIEQTMKVPTGVDAANNYYYKYYDNAEFGDDEPEAAVASPVTGYQASLIDAGTTAIASQAGAATNYTNQLDMSAEGPGGQPATAYGNQPDVAADEPASPVDPEAERRAAERYRRTPDQIAALQAGFAAAAGGGPEPLDPAEVAERRGGRLDDRSTAVTGASPAPPSDEGLSWPEQTVPAGERPIGPHGAAAYGLPEGDDADAPRIPHGHVSLEDGDAADSRAEAVAPAAADPAPGRQSGPKAQTLRRLADAGERVNALVDKVAKERAAEQRAIADDEARRAQRERLIGEALLATEENTPARAAMAEFAFRFMMGGDEFAAKLPFDMMGALPATFAAAYERQDRRHGDGARTPAAKAGEEAARQRRIALDGERTALMAELDQLAAEAPEAARLGAALDDGRPIRTAGWQDLATRLDDGAPAPEPVAWDEEAELERLARDANAADNKHRLTELEQMFTTNGQLDQGKLDARRAEERQQLVDQLATGSANDLENLLHPPAMANYREYLASLYGDPQAPTPEQAAALRELAGWLDARYAEARVRLVSVQAEEQRTAEAEATREAEEEAARQQEIAQRKRDPQAYKAWQDQQAKQEEDARNASLLADFQARRDHEAAELRNEPALQAIIEKHGANRVNIAARDGLVRAVDDLFAFAGRCIAADQAREAVVTDARDGVRRATLLARTLTGGDLPATAKDAKDAAQAVLDRAAPFAAGHFVDPRDLKAIGDTLDRLGRAIRAGARAAEPAPVFTAAAGDVPELERAAGLLRDLGDPAGAGEPAVRAYGELLDGFGSIRPEAVSDDTDRVVRTRIADDLVAERFRRRIELLLDGRPEGLHMLSAVELETDDYDPRRNR